MEQRYNWLEYKPQTFSYRGRWIDNWFSNMVPSKIFVGGELEWPSVENYYQAMKSEDPAVQETIRRLTPSQSKALGRRILLRPNWESLKEGYMKRALDIKFACSPWFDLLMDTGDSMIIEWNNWGDKYWGVTDNGMGKNRLGILLMQIRDEYKK